MVQAVKGGNIAFLEWAHKQGVGLPPPPPPPAPLQLTVFTRRPLRVVAIRQLSSEAVEDGPLPLCSVRVMDQRV